MNPGRPDVGRDGAVPADLPTALLYALRRFGPAWRRHVRSHIGEGGPSPARLAVLGHLASASAPLIMRELTGLLGTTARAVTALVDGLAADGLVSRSPHPHDRRATLVELSDAGRDVLHGRYATGFAAAADVFRALPEEDQEALLRILHHLTAVLGDEGTADGPCRPPG